MLTTVLGAALWWAVFVLVFRQDRRRVRNGVFFLIAAHSTLTLMARSIESTLPFGDLLVLASAVVAFIGVLALGAFMIVNGLTMVRKEGRSLGNLLSLLAGLALFAAPVASLALVLTQNAWASGLGGAGRSAPSATCRRCWRAGPGSPRLSPRSRWCCRRTPGPSGSGPWCSWYRCIWGWRS